MSTANRRAPKKRAGKKNSTPAAENHATGGSAEERVLDLLSDPDYHPVKAITVLKKLGGSPQLKADHRTALEALIAAGKVLSDSAGRLRPRHRPGVSIGRIKTTRSGDGWVGMNDPRGRDHDVYVRRSDMADAHDGDEVEVRITNRKGGRDGSRITGEVVAVLATGQTTLWVCAGYMNNRSECGPTARPVSIRLPGTGLGPAEPAATAEPAMKIAA